MAECRISEPHSESERGLMLEAAKFTAVMEQAYEELAPHKICGYIFDLANSFNRFYHENRILGEEDKEKQQGYLALLDLVKDNSYDFYWPAWFEVAGKDVMKHDRTII
mgnify:CR=1 FL=1